MEPVQELSASVVREVLYGHAAAHARRGEYATAERILTQLLREGDAHTDVCLLLGKVYAQQGRYQEAIAAWRSVLQSAPNHPEAAVAIAKAQALMAAPWGGSGVRPAAPRWWALGIVGCIVGVLLVYSAYQSGQSHGQRQAAQALRSSLQGYHQELTQLRGSLDALSVRTQAQTHEGRQHLEAQVGALLQQWTTASQQIDTQTQARHHDLLALLEQLRESLDALSVRQQTLSAASQQHLEAQVTTLQRHVTDAFQNREAQAQAQHQALQLILASLQQELDAVARRQQTLIASGQQSLDGQVAAVQRYVTDTLQDLTAQLRGWHQELRVLVEQLARGQE
jgi:tetratricopeptide (TPR) repeat protein